MNSNYYLDFENKFRGDRDSVVKKFSCYDALIELVIKNLESPKFIDVGCGRGEWLERWYKKVPNCWGIENDKKMAEFCRSKDLNIIEGEAIDSLKAISSNSISVITIFHMIEHLEYLELITLLAECHRVLNSSGILILETPSIDNLLVSAKNF